MTRSETYALKQLALLQRRLAREAAADWKRRLDNAIARACEDEDFAALCRAYLDGDGDRDLLKLLADRLIDLGIEPKLASAIIATVCLSHADEQAVPF